MHTCVFMNTSVEHYPKHVADAPIACRWLASPACLPAAVDDASRAKVSEVGRGVLKNFNDACLKCLMYPSERPVLEKYLQSLGPGSGPGGPCGARQRAGRRRSGPGPPWPGTKQQRRTNIVTTILEGIVPG